MSSGSSSSSGVVSYSEITGNEILPPPHNFEKGSTDLRFMTLVAKRQSWSDNSLYVLCQRSSAEQGEEKKTDAVILRPHRSQHAEYLGLAERTPTPLDLSTS